MSYIPPDVLRVIRDWLPISHQITLCKTTVSIRQSVITPGIVGYAKTSKFRSAPLLHAMAVIDLQDLQLFKLMLAENPKYNKLYDIMAKHAWSISNMDILNYIISLHENILAIIAVNVGTSEYPLITTVQTDWLQNTTVFQNFINRLNTGRKYSFKHISIDAYEMIWEKDTKLHTRVPYVLSALDEYSRYEEMKKYLSIIALSGSLSSEAVSLFEGKNYSVQYIISPKCIVIRYWNIPENLGELIKECNLNVYILEKIIQSHYNITKDFVSAILDTEHVESLIPFLLQKSYRITAGVLCERGIDVAQYHRRIPKTGDLRDLKELETDMVILSYDK